MKIIVEKLIQMRNPTFTFGHGVTNGTILHLLKQFGFAWLRGFFSGFRLVFLERGVRINGTVDLGSGVKIGEFTRISALGDTFLTIGDASSIGAFSRLIVSTNYQDLSGYIDIGARVGIGEYAYLGGAGGLEIGDDCIVGQYLSCHPENHIYSDNLKLIREQGVTRKGIKIGKNCWIGSKVTILDGVDIGDGCVIAAGAVVTTSFGPGQVLGGVPAKVIKARKNTPEYQALFG
jgi:acetyltransferase-like isoleucine patch superfamily enzyme